MFVCHICHLYIFLSRIPIRTDFHFDTIPKEIKTLPSSSSQSQPSSSTESENDDDTILCFLPMGEDINEAIEIAKNLLSHYDFDENALTAHDQSAIIIVSI